jgi:uncharacterized protein (DUF305 family)
MKILNFLGFDQFHKSLRRSLLTAIAIGGLTTSCSSPNDTATNSASTEAPKAQTQPISSTTPSPAKANHSGMNHGEMSLGAADSDYDLRFIDAMIPHHEGAVVMAKAVLQNSQRPELKKLANEIIQAQEKEIAEMKQWRKAWYPNVSDTPMAWHKEMNHMMPMTSEQRATMRMDLDLGKAGQDFDLRFINAMIPHHEGAVVMAEDAIAKSKRTDITKLAKGIISSQQIEIDQMKKWRKEWYKQ